MSHSIAVRCRRQMYARRGGIYLKRIINTTLIAIPEALLISAIAGAIGLLIFLQLPIVID